MRLLLIPAIPDAVDVHIRRHLHQIQAHGQPPIEWRSHARLLWVGRKCPSAKGFPANHMRSKTTARTPPDIPLAAAIDDGKQPALLLVVT